MKFSDLKIATRLAIGAIISLLILIIFGILAFGGLKNFHEHIDAVVKKNYPIVMLSNNVMSSLNNVFISQSAFFALTAENDENNINTTVEQIKKDRSVIVKHITTLSNYVQDDAELTAALNTIKQDYSKFAEASDVLLNLAKNRQDLRHQALEVTWPLGTALKKDISQFISKAEYRMWQADQTVNQSYSSIRIILLCIILAGVVISLTLSFVTARSVVLPLQQAVSLAESVAQGNLTRSIDHQRKDETGILLNALNKMTTNLQQLVGQLRDGAHSIASATAQIAAGNLDLSGRTEAQASSLEQTAASMNQLAATVKNTAENTQQANTLVNDAALEMKNSGSKMSDAASKMHEIRDSANHMVEIIALIDGIAFQTNILALNAAVEAARAGEQGRGFAVVASEVRSLAQRSAAAAKEIKALIDDAVHTTQQGMELVEGAEASMKNLSTNASHMSSIMSEIAHSSREQSVGIDQVNIGVGQLDASTQQNASLVEEVSAAAQSLQNQAQRLTDAVAVFVITQTGSTTVTPPTAATKMPLLAAASAGSTTASSNDNWTTF
ncbi:methyl-accepting chemotaxis protein [Candidatus Symbiopectobacterium sp. NZEC135]|uniref:methyl-accepting chemotaxis protein n=1 Tax=Candidatus Symbiopectobacterium sp. NZEC135 TaxID=2820471 RepID=UPI002225D382|nr:methyl-accepting chemotaxis protein [Candidatus Symbiopectobacterium sp. NZEC135]MCW2478516.1 HAMP domain-containing protein [Candidatus Symbiopectobacterium sp. NZEC135]